MKTFKHYLIEKPLTPSQRIARSRQMKRIMPKIKKKREIAMRKKASPDQLKMRAQKKAIDVVRKKFVPDGQDYASMTYAQKIQLDKKIEKKKKGMSQTIKTGPKGVTDEATIYTPTLLG